MIIKSPWHALKLRETGTTLISQAGGRSLFPLVISIIAFEDEFTHHMENKKQGMKLRNSIPVL